MIDRVVNDLGRKLVEVPVGFRGFVDGFVRLVSAGRGAGAGSWNDGTPWSTDKDGIIMCLLAAKSPHREKTRKSITMNWQRVLAPRAITVCRRARPPRKRALSKLSPEMVSASCAGRRPVLPRDLTAPGNGIDWRPER